MLISPLEVQKNIKIKYKDLQAAHFFHSKCPCDKANLSETTKITLKAHGRIIIILKVNNSIASHPLKTL